MPFVLDKKTGLIVFHGTSQDKMSRAENTVKLFDIAKDAGWRVEELGGPGSTERAMKTVLQADPSAAGYTRIEDIGLPLDYAWGLGAGVATGSGVEDNIREARELLRKLKMEGASNIRMVGFSRGADTIANLLNQLEAERFDLGLPLSVTLLDPVPGPLRRKHRKLPAFVDEVQLFASQHEGRPGFAPLDISVDAGTRLDAQVVVGVHGDIGGSTGSGVADLVLDDVLRKHKLPQRLTAMDRARLIMSAMEDPTPYVMPSLEHAIWPRKMRPSTGVGYASDNAVVFPYSSAAREVISQSQVLRLAASTSTAADATPRMGAAGEIDQRAMKLLIRKAQAREEREAAERETARINANMARMRRETDAAFARMRAWTQEQARRQALAEEMASRKALAERYARATLVVPQASFRNAATGRVHHPPPVRMPVASRYIANLLRWIPK
jgi:hypothetical protein